MLKKDIQTFIKKHKGQSVKWLNKKFNEQFLIYKRREAKIKHDDSSISVVSFSKGLDKKTYYYLRKQIVKQISKGNKKVSYKRFWILSRVMMN
ncbi:MAG: hypothetical protein HC905_26135 [Bacteroidales bacterium]|nr:hypothetical protein [Bacteroidales bacterium]